jgi:adenylosuccinate lyase
MIERYTLTEIGKIWTDENRFSIWLKIEILACEAQHQLGEISDEALKDIHEKAKFNAERILEIEEEVKHDMIAFLTNVGEYVGDASRYIHFGMTSSDVLDTALAVQMVEAGQLIKNQLVKLQKVLQHRALESKNTIMIGRSHGIHAEPMTLGLKFSLWYDEISRQIYRLEKAIESVRVGQISGAVGTFDHLDPFVQEYVCEKLGLASSKISSQVLQRDRHAFYVNIMALIGSTLEKIAIEIRHLQRTEVLEASEAFAKGQKGSSAMPHKKNPIIAERITGLARLIRGYATSAMENVALWHERDISHSSVERIILPDTTIALYYMLVKTTDLMENLVIYPENMERNLNITRGLIYSQAVMLALARKKMLREKAYAIVQRNAMRVWDENIDFKTALGEDSEIKSVLSEDELTDIFKVENRLKNVDYIYEKVGIKP